MSLHLLAAAAGQAAAEIVAAANAAGAAGQAMGQAATRIRPSVEVEIIVGPGGGREAEIIARLLTRQGPSVGNDMTSLRGRLALEHVMQRHTSAGFSTADARVAAIYQALATYTTYMPPAARGFGG